MDFPVGGFITPDQSAELEGFFKHCQYPSEEQEVQLAVLLGVHLQQIKLWFQNMRAQMQVNGDEMQGSESETVDGGEVEASNSRSLRPHGVLLRGSSSNSDPNLSKRKREDAWENEKTKMRMMAQEGLKELIMLMQVSEPLWVKSDSAAAGSFVLVPEIYENMFPIDDCLKGPNTRYESSKDSLMLNIAAIPLVNMLLDSDRAADLFPTVVCKAETVKAYDAVLVENRNGHLQLVNEETHVLSHLVPAREFYFLRYCKKVGRSVWMIVDVPLNSYGGRSGPFPARRLVSGCMIRQMPNHSCMVTWIEQVEANDKKLSSGLYSNLINNSVAYGAKRWLLALNRACERLSYPSPKNELWNKETEWVGLEGRKGSMKLSDRLVKTFFGGLNLSRKAEFTPYYDEGSEWKIYFGKNKPIEQPDGLILIIVGSFHLPLPPDNVFHVLNNRKRRPEWDVLSSGNPMTEIGRVSLGGADCHRISVYQIENPDESSRLLIFQESYKDALGSYFVYCPIDINAYMTMTEENASSIPILPSGLVVSGDGKIASAGSGGGSLLTVGYQIRLHNDNTTNMKEIKRETMEILKAFFTACFQKIKAALNCSD